MASKNFAPLKLTSQLPKNQHWYCCNMSNATMNQIIRSVQNFINLVIYTYFISWTHDLMPRNPLAMGVWLQKFHKTKINHSRVTKPSFQFLHRTMVPANWTNDQHTLIKQLIYSNKTTKHIYVAIWYSLLNTRVHWTRVFLPDTHVRFVDFCKVIKFCMQF